MKPITQSILAALVFSLMMTGCNGGNSVKSAVVNGNPVTATEDATFRAQYVTMCKTQTRMEQHDDDIDMDKVCECVGDKMVQYRQTERVEGEDAATAHMPEAMMSCIPGGNEMMREAREQAANMDEYQHQADEQMKQLQEQTGTADDSGN